MTLKAANRIAKDGKRERKRPCFATQNTAF